MICKVCGAANDDQQTHCRICAAPLTPDETPVNQDEFFADDDSKREPSRRFWGFVPAPQWPDPDLSIHAEYSEAEVSAKDSMKFEKPSVPEQEKAPVPPRRSSVSTARPVRQVVFQPEEAPVWKKKEPVAEPIPEAAEEAVKEVEEETAYLDENEASVEQAYEDSYEEEDVLEPMPPKQVFKRSAASRPAFQRGIGSSLNQRRHTRSSARKRSHKRRRVPLLPILIVVLVVVLLVIGGVFISIQHGGIGYFFSSVIGGSPILKPAAVTEGVNQKGNPAFIIDLFVKGGNDVELNFPTNKQTVPVGSSNYLQLVIEKELLIPDEPLPEATLSVVPDICVVTPEGERYPVELEPLSVNVPQITLLVTNPTETSVVSANGVVPVSGRVSDPTAAVFLNDQQLAVDASGNFAGEFTATEAGTYTIRLEARKNRYQTGVQTIQVEYTQTELFLTVDDKASLRTASGTGTVTGKMDVGAAVTGTGDALSGSVQYDSAAGTFSFSYTLSAGTHSDITLKAERSGVSTEKIITVEYAPEYEEYTKHCHQMDYARMTTETNHVASYKCVGTLKELNDMGEYYVGTLTTSKGDVKFEYHGTAVVINPEETRTFNMWADYNGVDESGLPKIYVWFITF